MSALRHQALRIFNAKRETEAGEGSLTWPHLQPQRWSPPAPHEPAGEAGSGDRAAAEVEL